jgi:hypothetical protein
MNDAAVSSSRAGVAPGIALTPAHAAFDLARHSISQAVRAGFIPKSLLLSARMGRSLEIAERLTLGPLARVR